MNNTRIKLFTLGTAGLAILYLFVGISQAGDNTWTTTGPYGARIGALAVDPANNDHLLAAILDSGQVFSSTDGGQTWQTQTGNLESGWRAMNLVFDPNNSSIVYLATGCGLYRSADGGDNWERVGYIEVNGTNQPIKASAVAISPLDSAILVGGTDGTCFTDPLNSDWIFKSTDGGQTWARVDLGVSSLAFFRASALVIAPSAPHIVYASSVSDAGVLKSTDGGATWTSINNGFIAIPSVTALAVDPYDSQVVYMGTSHQGIYKTTNGGTSWSPIGSGLSTSHISSIVIEPGNQQVIYVGGGDNPGTGTPGVYRSLDNLGLSWNAFMVGMGSRAIYSMVVDDRNPRNIYAGTQSGIWKYTLVSGPADYSIAINEGMLFTNQTAVTLTLTAPAGTAEVMVSNDGGFGSATWQPIVMYKPWTITAYGTAVIPRVVYAKFKTNGQISGQYQDDIILDQTPPTGTLYITNTLSTSIPHLFPLRITTDTLTNTVYLPIVGKNYRPGMRPVMLSLAATDDVSGVDSVIVSNAGNFTDAQWRTYARTLEWWVSDNGSTTVYVRYRDRAGNASPVYSATTTAPSRTRVHMR